LWQNACVLQRELLDAIYLLHIGSSCMTWRIRKRLVLLIVVLFLFAGAIGTQTIEQAHANWVIMPQSPNKECPTLILNSPTNNGNYVDSVVLNIAVTKPTSWNQSVYDPAVIAGISYIHYFLDNKENSLFETQFFNPLPNDELPVVSNFSKTISNLSSGQHTLKVTIYSQSQYAPEKGPFGDAMPPFHWYNSTVTETVAFWIQKSPKIQNISIEDKTYTSASVPLCFSIDKLTSWIGYSLDNEANITITGNTTLTDLAEGAHCLAVYANDTDGIMGKSETSSFTINTATPTPTFSPTPTIISSPTVSAVIPDSKNTSNSSDSSNWAIAAILITVIIVAACAVLLWRRQNHKIFR